MGTTPADLMDLQAKLMGRYNSGSWGKGFPDNPGEFGTVFDKFADVPNPDDFGAKTDALLDALKQLAPGGFDTNTTGSDGRPVSASGNSVLDQVAAVGVELDDWTGQAADGFFTWAMGWKTGIANQFSAMHALRELLHAEAAVWTAAMDDLKKLGDAAYEALEAADDEWDTGSGDFKAMLQISGAIIAVAGAVPTGGASLSLLAAVGAGVTVASTGMDLAGSGATESVEIRSCCPREVLNDLKAGVRRVEEAVKAAEETIKSDVERNIGEIEANWSVYCQPAPTLTTVPRDHIHAYEGLGTWGQP